MGLRLHSYNYRACSTTTIHRYINSFQQIIKEQEAIDSDVFATTAEKIISNLSFSHIRELLTLDDPLVRFFYETECIRDTWSVRELRRQITSNLHTHTNRAL